VGGNLLGGGLSVADTVVSTALFEVRAFSLMLSCLRLRTSSKLSPWAGFSVVLSAEVLAFSMTCNSFRVTIHVPYRALKSVFLDTALKYILYIHVVRSVFFSSTDYCCPFSTLPSRLPCPQWPIRL
jgi:hypothetical protein